MKRAILSLVSLILFLMCGGCLIVPVRAPVATPYYGYAPFGAAQHEEPVYFGYDDEYYSQTRCRIGWNGRPLCYPNRRYHQPRYSPPLSSPRIQRTSPLRETREAPSPFFDDDTSSVDTDSEIPSPFFD